MSKVETGSSLSPGGHPGCFCSSEGFRLWRRRGRWKISSPASLGGGHEPSRSSLRSLRLPAQPRPAAAPPPSPWEQPRRRAAGLARGFPASVAVAQGRVGWAKPGAAAAAREKARAEPARESRETTVPPGGLSRSGSRPRGARGDVSHECDVDAVPRAAAAVDRAPVGTGLDVEQRTVFAFVLCLLVVLVLLMVRCVRILLDPYSRMPASSWTDHKETLERGQFDYALV